MNFRIDPKYFYRFLLIVAVICIGMITFFSMNYVSGQEQRFAEKIGDGQDIYELAFRKSGTAQDSLSASVYKGSFVLVDFWSPWANRSLNAHELIYETMKNSKERLVVFSASVKDADENVIRYAEETLYPFVFVDGTRTYQDKSFPGVPTYLLFNPDGDLIHLQVGFTGPNDLEFLQTYLN